MEEFIATFSDAQYFTTFHVYSWYWKVIIRRKNRPITAFVLHIGTFQCVKMRYGLTRELYYFQMSLDRIITKFKWKNSIVYLDEAITLNKNVE